MSLRENKNEKEIYKWNQKETVGNSGTNNDERGLGEFDTRKTRKSSGNID